MFAWFHTTLLSHGLTMCLVSPAHLSSQTSTVHQTALMPLLDTKLWYLSGCYPSGCSRRKLLGLPEGFPYAIPGSPIIFLRSVAAWTRVSASFSTRTQAPSTAFSRGCCQKTHAFVTFLDVFVLFSHFDYDLWLGGVLAVLTCFSISFSSNQLSQSNR